MAEQNDNTLTTDVTRAQPMSDMTSYRPIRDFWADFYKKRKIC